MYDFFIPKYNMEDDFMIEINQANGCMDYRSKNTSVKDVCNAFEVKSIIRSLENSTGGECLAISVNDHGYTYYEFEVPASIIAKISGGLISELCDHQLVIPIDYEKDARKYITQQYMGQKRALNIEYRHSGLGWHKYNGSKYFLTEAGYAGALKSKSTRTEFKFRSGNEAAYKQFLKDKIYTNPTLSLGMALGYSAVVFSYLEEVYDFGKAVIVNLCGASSTGKTTISQLLVSPFGCPEISNSGNTLVRTFHSTSNALYAALDGVHGVPMVLDDITTNPHIDTAHLVYTLASGEDKGRCNAYGKAKSINAGWSGLIAISSEVPIEDSKSENQGLKARVIQTSGITWTPDAKTAEEIKSFVRQNYGHTGVEFAKFVSRLLDTDLMTKYQSAKDLVESIMTKRDNLSDRLATKYAGIALTIELMNECFELELDARELMQILIKPEQAGVDDRDISVKALDHIKNFIIKKRKNFSTRDRRNSEGYYDLSNTGDNLGDIVLKKEHTEVYIPTSTVEDILKSNKIAEVTTVKTRWKENGVTRCDKGRYDCKHIFNQDGQSTGTRCVCFILENDDAISDSNFNEVETGRTVAQNDKLEPPVCKLKFEDDEAIKEIFGIKEDKNDEQD
jgi:hypothetical protein